MGIALFPHNVATYRSASAMLAETGKAAVVHPADTGKSFIAFWLCAEHSDQPVCRPSPSEYIFKTQRENWLAAGGDLPENIKFFTYAKLMLLSRDEILEIQLDYIILDEFHRRNTEHWWQGVQWLQALYPQATVLGLSATNVCYLDN